MAGNAQRDTQEEISYADYLNWPKDERFEIIDGVSYAMNAPLRIHQKVSGEFFRQFANYFKGKTCEVYAAPFDVRLASRSKRDDEIFDVVQPDISIICDPDKLDEKGCFGSPDLIVEILSPATMSYDNVKKRALYEKTGVREFWLVHPTDGMVMAYRLKDGLYSKPEIFDRLSGAQSGIFPDLIIDMTEVFGPIPDGYVVKEIPVEYSSKPASKRSGSREKSKKTRAKTGNKKKREK
ncbi:MAG: Uma2 family endonuclease [Candidatus Riflebacteria bacterium HGW-Riflebacteria-2]|jgi:Uma2 family endonuclease|nr:MAG: Uma2 family endonuclease [Candidatus Riflebacteria bacterium HGW-Riflebacteria-2]